MKNNKTALKVVAYALILLAIVNVATVAIDFFSGNYSEEALSKALGNQWNSGLYMPYLICVIGIIAISIILEIFLGIRGIKQADGKVNKYGHITLATILFVLNAISCISGIFNIMNNKVDSLSFSQTIVMTLLLFLYISNAKALKEN